MRLCVGVIAELVDYLPYPFGKLRVDRGYTVNGSGHGCGRNFRSPGDLTDIHRVGYDMALPEASYHAPSQLETLAWLV